MRFACFSPALRTLVLTVTFAAPAAAVPATEARFSPRLDLVGQRPELAAHLVDGRGKVSVLLDLDDDQIPAEERALALPVAKGVGARWLAPEALPGFFSSTSAARVWVGPPLHPVLDRSAAKWTKSAAAHAAGHRGRGVLVGVIDTGLDVAHPDLRDPDTGKTRVAWMLDFSRGPLGKHAELEAAFGCLGEAGPCAVLAAAEIDAEMVSPARSRDVVGHGTHVASLAAGNGGKLGRYVGGAPEAELVIARITRGNGDTLTEADILDAVKFIFDRADAMQRPAVVNVSLGGDFGPHDGTSLLERGLAGFVGPDSPGHAIVVAAGNSGGICVKQDGVYGVHTETRVLEGVEARALLRAPTSTGRLTGASFVWVNFQAGDDVRVGIEWNGRTMIAPLASGVSGAIEPNPAAGYPYLAVINGVVGGVSPLPQGSSGAIVVIDGTWGATDTFGIHLEGHGLAQLWVQGTGEATTDGACNGLVFAGALKQGTVSVPATHPELLAVGCTVNRLSWPSEGATVEVGALGGVKGLPGDSACYFSGAGPSATGAEKPEIAAPGGFVIGAMSDDARPGKSAGSMFAAPPGTCDGHQCFVVDDRHAIASGTSMSAPQVTGAVALLLEADPSLRQAEIVALLQGGARRFEGALPLPHQLGPGALDVVGALRSLQERGAPRGLVPDGGQSWLSLGGAFARPSGAFSVPGTLSLRAADGGPADGFDARGLWVEVENGFVSEALTRRAPGAWSFAVAARGDAGGRVLRVRARYRDVVIGERALPIAADAQGLTSFPTATGGCGLAPFLRQSRNGAPPVAAGIMAALGLAAARRRSRRAARTELRRP